MATGTDPDPVGLTRELRRRAREAGFDDVGIAPAAPPSRDVARLESWLDAGHHASMGWMERHRDARRDPRRLLEGCRHVVVVTLDYAADADAAEGSGRPGRVARYARGRDYHRVFGKPLRRLAAWLEKASGRPARSFVDTGPVLERAFAERAGLGWIGKNACLIDPERGSWFVLGEILTAADLVDDPGPVADRCGTCNACQTACPTGAILEPGLVDANRCIAYWTIEHRGPLPVPVRAEIDTWMFGCDDCQTACPWNRTFGRPARAGTAYEVRPDLAGLDPVEVLDMDEAAFRSRFEGTPLMRARFDGLRRNACVVLGNLGDPGAVPALARALDDADPLIRSHSAWALGRIGGRTAAVALREAASRERDANVGAEIARALDPPSGS